MKTQSFMALVPGLLGRQTLVNRVLVTRVLVTMAAIAVVLTSGLAFAQPAAAYPFWAQENYDSPREATGKIVCANCHLGAKPTEVEVPQAVLPDSVFKAVVKIPYDTDAPQILGDGSEGGLNVGAVLMLPDGFKIAPSDRISEELKEEVGSTYFMPYSEEHENWVLVGPLPGEDYQEIVFPVLSPDPTQDRSVYFGKYAVHVGGNRGRGQVYPTGQATNNVVYTADASGVINSIDEGEYGGYSITIQPDAGDAVVTTVPAGPELIVAVGDTVTKGTPVTSNPNVGGFGQVETEIVLQSPNRIKGLVAFLGAVVIAQIMLVLKKKQVEKVQAAEMSF